MKLHAACFYLQTTLHQPKAHYKATTTKWQNPVESHQKGCHVWLYSCHIYTNCSLSLKSFTLYHHLQLTPINPSTFSSYVTSSNNLSLVLPICIYTLYNSICYIYYHNFQFICLFLHQNVSSFRTINMFYSSVCLSPTSFRHSRY